MIKVIGQDSSFVKQITCRSCGAIHSYLPIDVKTTNNTDEGVPIKGIACLQCGDFLRINY